MGLVGALGLGETIAAVNRSAVTGLERDLGLFTASGTHSREHLTDTAGVARAGTTAGLFACLATGWAPLWFVGEAFGGEELLLRGAESKISSAVRTLDGFVLGHG